VSFGRGSLAAVLLVATGGCGWGTDERSGGWTTEQLPTRAEYESVFFIDPDRGFIVGGNFFIDGGIVGATTDGGRTWSFSSGLVRAKPGFRLTDIVFLDRFTGIVAGSHGVILRTVDRGRRWHVVWRGLRSTNHLLDLFFLEDGLHGWAVGHTRFLATTDGGASWAPATTDREVGGGSVHFIDRDRGFVAGKFGRIFATTDGGGSWRVATQPTGTGQPDILGITFVGPNLGWAVGEGGTILHTTDGGTSWRRQATGVRSRLCAVSFVDSDNGWVVGHDRGTSSSVVLRTVDGGRSWTVDHELDGELLRTVHFLDAEHGWAAGERPEHGPQTLLRLSPR
jgi:photosystem II stability/assembly factor-like uncharacterized protein